MIRRMKCLICRFINFAAAVDSDGGNVRENIRYNNRLRQRNWREFPCGWISGGEFSDLLEERDSMTEYSSDTDDSIDSDTDDSNNSDMDDSNDSDMDEDDSDMDDANGEDDNFSVEY